jgi:hypothetical protein
MNIYYNIDNKYKYNIDYITYNNESNDESNVPARNNVSASAPSSTPTSELSASATIPALKGDDETVNDEKSYVDNITCTICMENKKQMCLDCGHQFCMACSTRLDKTCFICKEPFKMKIKLYD